MGRPRRGYVPFRGTRDARPGARAVPRNLIRQEPTHARPPPPHPDTGPGKHPEAPALTAQDLDAVFRALTGTAPTAAERAVLHAVRRKNRPRSHPTP